jgi:HTH-type transcriptional regulator/antitoxin HigA
MTQVSVSPIRNDADLMAALALADQLMDEQPEPGSPRADLLEVWATLIEAYEAKHYPVTPPDPIEAIKFRMEQSGLSVTDLVPMIGNPNRVYEILNRKRPLTLRMIRNLNHDLGIPVSSLIA